MIKIGTDTGNVHRKLSKYQTLLEEQVQVRLEAAGSFMENEMEHKIEDGLNPPLKDETIARKGSSKPLFDTGELVNQIDHEVKGNVVEVGVFGSKGNGAPRANIARIHELGAPAAGIPERSFMRSAFNENKGKIKKIMSKKN